MNVKNDVELDKECKAKLKVKDEVLVGSLHEHTHAPDEARIEVLSTKANNKRRAEETEEPPQQILGKKWKI